MKKIYCDINKCLGCRTCEIACAVEHSKSKELHKSIGEWPVPVKRRRVQLILKNVSISDACHHCNPAACVTACMSGAMSKDKKTGHTMHDKEKCVGCWMCIMACPFGAISKETTEKIILKCDMCPDRDIPACVASCPTKTLFLGTAEEFKKKI